jgi:hypothetical protein
MTSEDINRENDASRQELAGFIASLDDASLAADTGNGWTAATVLCHLAFWDERAIYLLRLWKDGRFEPFQLTPQAIDSLNVAARVISRAVPVRDAAALALASAAAADGEVAGLAAQAVENLQQSGFDWSLTRSVHRRAHLRTLKEKLQAR